MNEYTFQQKTVSGFQNRLNHPKSPLTSQRQQRGIATILLVVLVGIAVTASALGVMHSTRSAQEKQVATHAAVHAQSGLWTGVEAFRRYLGELNAAQITALHGTSTLSIGTQNFGFGTLTAKQITVTTNSGIHRVSAQIFNNHGDAKASAGVGVVFEVDPNACETCFELSNALTFRDDLSGTGHIELAQIDTINVDGDINFANINISELDALNATGSVSIDSSVTVHNIHSNSDITISGGASVDSVRTQGNVTVNGSSSTVDVIEANLNVTLNGETDTMRVDSLGHIYVGPLSGNHSLLRAAGNVELQQGIISGSLEKYDGAVNSLFSVGNIGVLSEAATVVNMQSEGDLTCGLLGWADYTSLAINGTISANCAEIHADMISASPSPGIVNPATITVAVMDPVPAFALPPVPVDVFKLKQDANYVIEEDGGDIRVTVYNINGETNGTSYYLANYDSDSNKPDALCPTRPDASGNCVCSSPIVADWPNGIAPGCNDPEKYLCIGDSPNGSCVDYASGTFTVTGNGIAPGIWWIDGNLTVRNGYNNATILVTGNVDSSSGQYRGAAVNYGFEPTLYTLSGRTPSSRTTPYQEICAMLASGFNERATHLIGEYRTRFGSRYPTNLCDLSTQTYFPIPTGNIALAAGGIRPAAVGGDGSYSGGDINIAANSQIYGITLAGGYLNASDSAVFFGHVSASALGTHRADAAVKNSLSGHTIVVQDTETAYYRPNETTNMGDTAPCTGGCLQEHRKGSVVLWSKFL